MMASEGRRPGAWSRWASGPGPGPGLAAVVAGCLALGGGIREGLSRPASTVLVLPLEDRGVSYDLAQAVTESIVGSLVSRGFEVTDRARAKQVLDVELAGQAGFCRGDVFCLVETAELFGVDLLVSGHLSVREAGRAGRFYELTLLAVDVPRAKRRGTQIFRVLASGEVTVAEMAETAARQLLTEPDIEVAFAVTPGDAVLEVYGERLLVPADGGPMRYWSGVYEINVVREAYRPKRVRLTLGAMPEAQPVVIDLEPDPLHVARGPSGHGEPVFSSERAPSRTLPSLDVVQVAPSAPGAPARSTTVDGAAGRRATPIGLSTILAASLVAGGLSLGVAGGWLQGRAQGHYNDLAREPRFGAETRSADVARTIREDAREHARVGGALLVSGVLAVGLGVAWWFVDSSAGASP